VLPLDTLSKHITHRWNNKYKQMAKQQPIKRIKKYVQWYCYSQSFHAGQTNQQLKIPVVSNL
jgi:hypothetical protein